MSDPATTPATAPGTTMERLRVLTLNIWNRQGPWEARRRLILDGLRAEAPDVIALQEVLRLEGPDGSRLCQGEDLGQALGCGVSYGEAMDIGGGLRFGNAILSRFPALESCSAMLPNPEGHEARSVVFALLSTPAGALPVFATHLDWQLDLSRARCEQVLFIADRMAPYLGPTWSGLPPVLAGDLNAEPDSDEVRFLRGLHCLPVQDEAGRLRLRSTYLCDTFGMLGQGPGETFARSNAYAAREREPDRRLDYIFVGPPDRRLRGEPLAARRCFTEPAGGVFASDHYGVVADLQVAPRDKEKF